MSVKNKLGKQNKMYDAFTIFGESWCWAINQQNETIPIRILEAMKSYRKNNELYIIKNDKHYRVYKKGSTNTEFEVTNG